MSKLDKVFFKSSIDEGFVIASPRIPNAFQGVNSFNYKLLLFLMLLNKLNSIIT